MNYLQNFLLILLILFILLQSESNAGFGVKLGIVTTKYEQEIQSGENQSTNTFLDETRIGPTMGISYRYLDYDFFDFESEIFYVQKGGQDSFEITTINSPEGTGEIIIFDNHFDYLQLQTVIRPKVDIDTIELYGIIGFSLNYLLGVRNDIRIRDKFRDFVFAYSIGAGIEFKDILNQSLLFEFLLNADLTNIYQDSESEYKFQTYIFLVVISFN
jgi:hypothetical protein